MVLDKNSFSIEPGFLKQPKASTNDRLSPTGNSNPKLKSTVKELEALFIYELLKEMRKSTQGGLLGKGLGSDVYTSLFDMEVAKSLAQRGLGLGDMILKQLSRPDLTPKENPSLSPEDPHKTSILQKGVKDSPPVAKAHDQQGEEKPEERSFQVPVHGLVSSNFGWRKDPFSEEEKFHYGIDIAASKGQEIYPGKQGRVIFSGLTQGLGNTVIIDHGDGFVSKYAHNLINLVAAVDEVRPGQVIALVGSTGKSTGPHLHFEVLYNGKKMDPIKYIQS